MVQLNIFDLPELLEQILYFLEIHQSLYPTLFVNHLWYHCGASILWQHIEFFNKDYQQSQRALNMSWVLIRRLINFERVMRRKIKPTYCTKMVYLRLEGLKISDALISVILRSCPDIRFLILDKSKGFTNIPIIEIARFSPKLQHLSFNSCICLTNRCITEITHSCSKLRHLELGDCSIGNEAIEKIASNCTNLKYLSLKECRRISNEVLKKLNPKIKIKRPDYSNDEFSDSDLPSLIPIFTGRQNRIAITRSFRDYYLSHTSNETDLISAIVNYLRENPLTQLKEDYGICDPVENLYGDVISKIKCLDLQFCYKEKWRSLDDTEMCKAKISFGHSLKTYDSYVRIVIDGISIPLIKENSNKDSFMKNNSPNSNPSPKDIEDIIRFIIHAVEKEKMKKAKVTRTISVSKSESSVSDSSNSSTSSSEIEVIHIHKTGAVRKHPILKRKVKGKVNYRG
ncbi:14610_t:CDS:2 [Cetraspora pellucida]|uniref:14610_t:CDS:1 n=1 Tax=Cetraspora pellucida TaxID=1433469 RepID=A0ACA9LXE2_9GLOM|nr:14610_t:CDS:2 [Cetraspora pellucida]